MLPQTRLVDSNPPNETMNAAAPNRKASTGRSYSSSKLLDQFLLVVRLPATTNDNVKYAKLSKLERKTRSFLDESSPSPESTQTFTCGYVALCIRVLFLVHGAILDILQD